MEQAQPGEDTNTPPSSPITRSAREAVASPAAAPQVAPALCPTCGVANGVSSASTPYVYAIGRIESRFPRLSVEKEFAQATGRAATAGLSDRQALQTVLQDRQNRYLLRQLCWVFTVQGIETYILAPRDPADSDLLVQALRASPGPADLDLVVGIRGPIAGPDVCNGLTVPIVMFDQIYSFDRDSLLRSVPRPPQADAEKFAGAAGEVFDRLHQQTDNAGATDADRALNYLSVRYPGIYAAAADAFAGNASLTSVEVKPSPLSGIRNIVEVIFSFTNRATDVTEKQFVRVDVTEKFPFLVTKMSPYFDR
jgi:PatG C-terminal